jgi:hypothetical protein
VSIYASTLILSDEEHEEDCPAARPGRRTRKGKWIAPTCLCGTGSPLVYQRSHVLPSDEDERGGSFDFAEIPGFITRENRELCGPDDECPKPESVCCDRVWPWLRVGMGDEVTHLTQVWDRRQVEVVRDYLTRWLECAGRDVS